MEQQPTDPSARDERRNAILSIYSDLAEIESELAHLQAEKERLRNELSILIAEDGGKAVIPGVARMELTAPSITTSYDRKAIYSLVQELVASGHGDIAEAILRCQKQSQRVGTLRITPERKL
jgi:uncharacterized small protein (DUF1192 family)